MLSLSIPSNHFVKAQVKNLGTACLSNELKALTYTINDVDARETSALAWLAKFGKGNCPAAELDAIANNAPLWLGTSYTPKVNQPTPSAPKRERLLQKKRMKMLPPVSALRVCVKVKSTSAWPMRSLLGTMVVKTPK